MSSHNNAPADPVVREGVAVVITVGALDALIVGLRDQGVDVYGPVVRDGAIAVGPLNGVADLPIGWRDEQAPGHYALNDAHDTSVFRWAVGPNSFKATFFPPEQDVWRASRSAGPLEVLGPDPLDDSRPMAIVGARPCDVAALEVLDGVLLEGAVPDPSYRTRRSRAIVVVAECATPAATCFCSSMGTGPGVDAGFDLALSEIEGHGEHRFVVRVGSPAGATLVNRIEHRIATEDDLRDRRDMLERAGATFDHRLDVDGLAELLKANIEHPEWDNIAARCLACANCTMVCPTCFCSDVTDTSDLTGDVVRRRHWSSCFELGHSFVHGGPVRASTASRYRQWMTHKLSTWWDQFGSSGCVGCGRCITWCPVGIDLTSAAAAIRATPGATRVSVRSSERRS